MLESKPRRSQTVLRGARQVRSPFQQSAQQGGCLDSAAAAELHDHAAGRDLAQDVACMLLEHLELCAVGVVLRQVNNLRTMRGESRPSR